MTIFQDPHFTFWNVFYAATGATVFWSQWGKTRLKPYVLGDIIELLPINDKMKSLFCFLLFVAIGCIVAVGVIEPTNAKQAFSAGLGWTGALAHPSRR